MVCNNLLDDRRPDLGLWWWRWGRERCRWRGRRTLFFTTDYYFVFDHFTLTSRWGRVAATDYKLLPLSRNQVAARSRWRQTLITSSADYKSVLVHITLSAIPIVLAMLVAENDLFPISISRPRRRRTLPEPDIFALYIDFAWPWTRWAIATAEHYIFAFDFPKIRRGSWPRLFAASNSDVISLDFPNARSRRGWSATASDDNLVLLNFAATTRGRGS